MRFQNIFQTKNDELNVNLARIREECGVSPPPNSLSTTNQSSPEKVKDLPPLNSSRNCEPLVSKQYNKTNISPVVFSEKNYQTGKPLPSTKKIFEKKLNEYISTICEATKQGHTGEIDNNILFGGEVLSDSLRQNLADALVDQSENYKKINNETAPYTCYLAKALNRR